MSTDQIVIEIIPADMNAPLEYRFVETITDETVRKARADVRALKRDPAISGARMFGLKSSKSPMSSSS